MAQRIFEVRKILSESDVDDKVALPAEIRKHMLPMLNGGKIMELTASDRWGQQWQLKYCSYTQQTGKFKNPVLSGADWHKFVEENGVRAGDELIFSGYQVAGADGVLEYRIQVKRQTETFNLMSAAVHDSGADDGVSFYGEEVIKPKSQTGMTFQGNAM